VAAKHIKSPQKLESLGRRKMITEIIAVYAITDDLLNAIGH
jgi:hypothetical protein